MRAGYFLAAIRRYGTVYVALFLLAVLCLGWSVIALPAYYFLPRTKGAAVGRRGIMLGFCIFVGALRLLRAYRLDLSALEPLSKESGIILAPNHPHLIDALVLLTIHSNIVCVQKAQIMKNVFLGAGSRLARFISNESPRHVIAEAVNALKSGAVLLLFPEGTRTVHHPVNELQHTVGVVAKHALAPVQTLLIETNSPYLSKGWSLFRVPELPITYRIRLGRRFEAPSDARQLTATLSVYFASQLAHSPQRTWLSMRSASRASLHTG